MATVLITGTSTGIGFATALAFGRAGHRVAATMRNPSRAPELANIAAQGNLPITVSAMDVDADASVTEGIGRIEREIGPIDVLVNNAGIERTGSVEELPPTNEHSGLCAEFGSSGAHGHRNSPDLSRHHGGDAPLM